MIFEPLFRINDDGYLLFSLDNGCTWKNIGPVRGDAGEGTQGPQGPEGPAGADGKDGKDGVDGQDGQDGRDGTDGINGVTPLLKIVAGYLYASYDNWTTQTQLGKVQGEQGERGLQGFTPRIDSETKHWFINNEDTGILAQAEPAGTLNTTATTAQTISDMESLSGNVVLHKVAKTGDYEDLLNRPFKRLSPTPNVSDPTQLDPVDLNDVKKRGFYWYAEATAPTNANGEKVFGLLVIETDSSHEDPLPSRLTVYDESEDNYYYLIYDAQEQAWYIDGDSPVVYYNTDNIDSIQIGSIVTKDVGGTTVSAGEVVAIQYPSNACRQILFTDAGVQYHRIYRNNAWSLWAEDKLTDTDTKNTAGSQEAHNRIYLVGVYSAPSQYSHDTTYAGDLFYQPVDFEFGSGHLYVSNINIARGGGNNGGYGGSWLQVHCQTSESMSSNDHSLSFFVRPNADIYVKGVGGFDGAQDHTKEYSGYETVKTLQDVITSLESRIAALEGNNS